VAISFSKKEIVMGCGGGVSADEVREFQARSDAAVQRGEIAASLSPTDLLRHMQGALRASYISGIKTQAAVDGAVCSAFAQVTLALHQIEAGQKPSQQPAYRPA
jgi:hypothetical protein